MIAKTVLKRLFASFFVASSTLIIASNAIAENWIPISGGNSIIFIPQYLFKADEVSPYQYQLSWNHQHAADNYKIERLTFDAMSTDGDLPTHWVTVADTTTNSWLAEFDITSFDLGGHQTFRLSKCFAGSCEVLDTLDIYLKANELPNVIPQDFTLTSAPIYDDGSIGTPSGQSIHVSEKSFSHNNQLSKQIDVKTVSDNPYSKGYGFSMFSGHENPNGHTQIDNNQSTSNNNILDKNTSINVQKSSASQVISHQVYLSWTEVESATHYVIDRKVIKANSPTKHFLKNLAYTHEALATEYTFELAGGEYEFRVYACYGTDKGYCAGATEEKYHEVVLPINTDLQPQNVAMSSGGLIDVNESFNLTWTVPPHTDTTELLLTGFNVYGELQGLIASESYDGSQNNYSITRNQGPSYLVPGRQYCYKIVPQYLRKNDNTTINGQPGYPAPDQCVAVGPDPVLAAPDNFSIVEQPSMNASYSRYAYNFSWDEVTNADYYQLDREVTFGQGDWQPVYQGSNTWSIEYLTESRNEAFRISACYDNGICGNYRRLYFWAEGIDPWWADGQKKKPQCLEVPATITAGETLEVSWCPSEDASVTAYELREYNTPLNITKTPSEFGLNMQGLISHTVPIEALGGYDYCFGIKAVYGSSKYGSDYELCGAIIPADLAGFDLISSNDNTTHYLTWNADDVTEYQLQYYFSTAATSNINESSWLLLADLPKEDNSYINISRDNGHYYYRARSCNSNTHCSAWSATKHAQVTGILTTPVSSIADAPIINLTRPSTTDIVGQVKGSGQVSNGQAMYQLPISVPPGIKGVAPNVSINYSSGAGNGIVGVGWSLNAYSSIARCSANWAEDGKTGPVSLTDDDLLCFNGQKLVKVAGGSYGSVNSEYRTKHDSFAKIQLLGDDFSSDSSYFKVWHKSGRISYFGNSTDSIKTPNGSSVPMAWAVNKEHDNNHTKLNIIYEYTSNNGEMVLDDIYYTGQTDNKGDRRINFGYEVRIDNSISNVASAQTKQSKRLNKVTTYVGTTKVFEYSLTYDQSPISSLSRLVSFTQCGFDGTTAECLPAKEFTYSGDAFNLTSVEINTEPTKSVYNSALPWNIKTQTLADFNSDGIVDVVRYDQLHLMKFENNEYTIDKVYNLPFKYWGSAVDPSEVIKFGQVDIGLDGIPDLLGVNPAGNLAATQYNASTDSLTSIDLGISMYCEGVHQYMQTYNGSYVLNDIELQPINGCAAETVADGTGGYYLFHRRAFEDLYVTKIHPSCTVANGDGTVDGVCNNHSQLISGIDKERHYLTNPRHWQDPQNYSYMDFDGDGDPDIVRLEQITNDSESGVRLVWFRNDSTGYGINETNNFVKITNAVSSSIKANWAMASGVHWIDANGDGLSDLLINSDKWYLMINTGGQLSAPVDIGIDAFQISAICSMNCSYEEPGTTSHGSIRVLDFNGDGLQDFMVLDHTTTRNVDPRDCLTDRHGDYCKEGKDESPHFADYNVSPLAYGHFALYTANLDASGNVSFNRTETEIKGSMNNFYAMDLNSDGNLDFIGGWRQYDGTIKEWSHEYVTTYIQMGKSDITGIPADLLITAKDSVLVDDIEVESFKAKEQFEYIAFSQLKKQNTGSIVVDNSDLTDKPYYRIPTTQTVVKTHKVKNVIDGTNQTNYHYGDPIYHQAGLGFLGFEFIQTTNLAQGTTTVANYLMDYPLNGKTSDITTTETSDGSILKLVNHTWCDITTDGCNSANVGVFFPHLTSRSASYYNPDGSTLKTHTASFDSYDSYGNITASTSTIVDNAVTHVTVTESDYHAADTTDWWVNKLNYEKITKTVSYVTDYGIVNGTNESKWTQRNVTWKPNQARQLNTEIITASDTGISSIKTYDSYDSYGNLTKLTQSGTPDPQQANTNVTADLVSEYSYTNSDGYFINTEKNGLWAELIANRTWDARFGLILSDTNVNNVTIGNQYNSFGQKTQTTSTVAPTIDYTYRWAANSGVYEVISTQDGTPNQTKIFNRGGKTVEIKTQAFANNVTTSQIQIQLFEYDGLGRLIEKVEPHFAGDAQAKVTYSGFDVLNRYTHKVVDKAPQSYTVDYAFNALDTNITVTPTNGTILQMSHKHGALNQLLSTTDAISGSTYYHYDANGNTILIKDVANSIISAKYDGFNNKQWFEDPNLGKWYFAHNGLGQARWQQDARSITTNFTYDGLGRITRNQTGDDINYFIFDSRAKGHLTRHYNSQWSEELYYDNYARLIKSTTNITHKSNTRSFDIEYAYDGYYGRVKGMRYPTGELLELHYDQYGYTTSSLDPNNANAIYHSVIATNASGKTHKQSYGNGLYGRTEYTASGAISRVCVNISNTCAAHDSLDEIEYDDYDSFGNLKSQKDLVNKINETYTYDDLHRIESSTRTATGIVSPTFTPSATLYYDYDASGNLIQKDDYASSYIYNDGTGLRPNAVKSITKITGDTVTFNYDDNGNMTSGDGITLEYNAFNKPKEIIRNSVTLTFDYDANNNRYKQVSTQGAEENTVTVTTFYVSKIYERIETEHKGTLSIEKRHYLGDSVVKTHKDNGDVKISYLHRDRLGSATLITDGNKHLNDVSGATMLVLERRGFDVFGKARDLTWGDSNLGLLVSNVTTRGFTDHEHLDSVELIHMNGRAYDYNLGRFLSVDPFIQMPTNSQSVNPYSYIMNNPLAGTDPSGYLADFWRTSYEYKEKDKEKDKGSDQNPNVNQSQTNQSATNETVQAGDTKVTGQNSNYDPRADSDASLMDKLSLTWELISEGDVIITAVEMTDQIYFGGIPVGETMGVGEIMSETTNMANSVATGDVGGTAMSAAKLALGRFKILKFKGGASPEMIRGTLSLLVQDGKIDYSALMAWIPKELQNSFKIDDRISSGQKYQFKIGDVPVEIKWHSADKKWIGSGNNSGSGITAQITVDKNRRKRYLTTEGDWVKKFGDETHIPVVFKK